jgi:hypothetical protein
MGLVFRASYTSTHRNTIPLPTERRYQDLMFPNNLVQSQGPRVYKNAQSAYQNRNAMLNLEPILGE